MQTRQDDAQRRNRIFHTINKYFMRYDIGLAALSLILTFVLITKPCYPQMFIIYTALYCFQTLQHYLIAKFPKIDINKHHVLYRRVIIFIGFVDVGYLFVNVMFWSKNESHPLYCVLCKQIGFGLWIGLLASLHFFVIATWFFALINSYIQRRYYLLALGGFEAEQAINEQRERRNQQMMIRQPNYEIYNTQAQKNQKYFKFEDVIQEEIQENNQCSICLNEMKNGEKLVNAGCGHLYHEECLRNWMKVKVNFNCPQCREPIRQSSDHSKKQNASQIDSNNKQS